MIKCSYKKIRRSNVFVLYDLGTVPYGVGACLIEERKVAG